MDKDMPADWALERAVELANANGANWTAENTKQHHFGGMVGPVTMQAFARYIEAHEQPPVDPDLVTAREICAAFASYFSSRVLPSDCKNGEFDHATAVQFALAKLKEARGK